MKVFLETERLILRQFTEEDTDNLLELDSNPVVMRYINGGNSTDYEVIRTQLLPKWINYYEKYENYGIWAAIEKSSHEFIGWLHFLPATENKFVVELNLVKEDEIALGYRLRQSSWGHGYATEGSRTLILKGFTEWGVQRVIGWALTENKASIRVMEKVGLKLEKTFFFRESQLPTLKPSERKAVMYRLDKDKFITESSQLVG